MLSIHPLDSAEGAASYYLDVVNYYANDSKSVRWLGEGAKKLGIHGQAIDKDQMTSLLKGKLPDGTQLGKIDKDGLHHRPGFDMTVSAPKSFSILLESGADPRLAEVLDDTVEWFVGEMEQEFAQTRKITDGEIEYVNTGNFVVSAFRQPNSRANDPQSHVHLVVHNMTHSPDGKWRSLASDMEARKGVVEQIMKHHIYGGLKFRNKLANATKDLGYKLHSNGDGIWEISGVPKEILSHFSKRREAIEAVLEEKGWSGAKASSIAAQRTKIDKEILDVDQWRDDITQELEEFGFNPHEFVASIGKSDRFNLDNLKEKMLDRFYGKENRQINKAREAVYVAIESVSQQHAVFDMKDIKKEALKFSIASSCTIDEKLINQAIKEEIKDQNLYDAIHPYTQQSLFTTPWQLTLETETIARIEQGKKAIQPVCSTQQVKDFIQNRENELKFALSSSQKRAMMSFLTSKDRYIAIQGYAGTGKTTMLKLTQELATSQGYSIRGITAGSSAANELAVKGGINATTFARELGQLQREKKNLSKTIFVVDEASMLSNPQGHKIIKLVEEFNTQLKIIGDKAQLPSPSSGKFFSLIQDYGIHTTQMTDNLRQKDQKLKEAAIHAGKGEIYDAVEKISQIHTAESYQERIDIIAEHWISLNPADRANTLCFAPTHKNRNDITEVMREALKKEGTLQGVEHQHTVLKERNMPGIKLRKSIYFSENDVLRFNTNISHNQIRAGDYLTVGALTEKNKKTNSLPLIRADGSTLIFKLSSLPKFKTHNMDLERAVEVYTKHSLDLVKGDKVQWKRNSESFGIRNSELGTIKSISAESIEIIDEKDKSVILSRNANELKHIEHGYVLTTYASQGKDKKYGLGLIESHNRFATTVQNFYVEITRAIESMTIVTDDKDQLIKGITLNNSEKYSALEMTSTHQLQKHEERFKQTKNQVNLYEVIQKKFIKEDEWIKYSQIIDNYKASKLSNSASLSAKLAHGIVQDSKLYRLAREKLAFKTSAYRKDALSFETAKLFNSLTKDQQKQFSIVRQYVSINQKIEKSLEQIKRQDSFKEPRTVQNGCELIKKRNEFASMISNHLDLYKPYLKHFSIGELNRIGLFQHEYRAGELKACIGLEELIKNGSTQSKEQVYDEIQQRIEKIEVKPILSNKKEIALENRNKNSIKVAKEIWEDGVALKNSPAEKYLKEHVGLKDISKIDAKYLPNKSALIFAARNNQKIITGIHGLSLGSQSPQGFTNGMVKESHCLIQKGMRGSDLYITEKLDVALRMSQHDSKATIVSVLHSNDSECLPNLIAKYRSKNIILVTNENPSKQLLNTINESKLDKCIFRFIAEKDLFHQVASVSQASHDLKFSSYLGKSYKLEPSHKRKNNLEFGISRAEKQMEIEH